MNRLSALVCALVLAVTACGGNNAAGSDAAAPSATTVTTTTESPAPTTTAPVPAADGATTTTAVPPFVVDVGDPANWPLTAPDLQLPVTFTDAGGNEVTVTSADRIGSLYGAATEILWTLGLGDRLVVVDATSQYPEDVMSEVVNVGFFRVLPAEGIIAQSPDVVFLSIDAGPPETIAAMEAAGITLVRVPDLTEDVASFKEMVDMIGTATGIAEHATAFSDAVVANIAAVSADVAKDAPLVLYAVARGQDIYLTGLGSPSNAIIAAAGFRSGAAVLEVTAPTLLTPEAIVVADPDVILTTASSVGQAGGAEAFLATPGLAESKAGRNSALIVWGDDAGIQLWTPRTPAAILELRELVEGLTG